MRLASKMRACARETELLLLIASPYLRRSAYSGAVRVKLHRFYSLLPLSWRSMIDCHSRFMLSIPSLELPCCCFHYFDQRV
jgi:hypothetical protein